jgi:hypothetical protein
MTYEHERNITPVSRRKVSSYEIKFYDMDGNEMLIPDKPLSQAYTEIDEAIYEWEMNGSE